MITYNMQTQEDKETAKMMDKKGHIISALNQVDLSELSGNLPPVSSSYSEFTSLCWQDLSVDLEELMCEGLEDPEIRSKYNSIIKRWNNFLRAFNYIIGMP